MIYVTFELLFLTWAGLACLFFDDNMNKSKTEGNADSYLYCRGRSSHKLSTVLPFWIAG